MQPLCRWELIWNPFGTLDIGAEYLLGWNERKDRQTGTAPRIPPVGSRSA